MTNAPTNWIPVAQELPPESKMVLTKREAIEGTHHACYLRRRGAVWEREVNPDWPEQPPTHWARD